MIGDINLFLTPDNEEDEDTNEQPPATAAGSHRSLRVIGEVEIMIAEKTQQGKGLGREILLTFLWYIVTSLDSIMAEYHGVHGSGRTASTMEILRVKIDKDNVRSIKLFESVGFTRVQDEPNYFGELERRRSVASMNCKQLEAQMGMVPKVVEYKAEK